MKFTQEEVDSTEILRDIEVMPSEAIKAEALGPTTTVIGMACLAGGNTQSAT